MSRRRFLWKVFAPGAVYLTGTMFGSIAVTDGIQEASHGFTQTQDRIPGGRRHMILGLGEVAIGAACASLSAISGLREIWRAGRNIK